MLCQAKRRGGAPSAEELESALWNKEPGCPDLAIMSFVNGFHGRTTGGFVTLSLIVDTSHCFCTGNLWAVIYMYATDWLLGWVVFHLAEMSI